MKKIISLLLTGLLLLSSFPVFATSKGTDNLNNSSGELVIGYIGGSITQGVGATNAKYRWSTRLVNDYYKKKYPNKKVKEINAGIGGTPSSFGQWRINSEVGDYAPDVVFVEFAVNDANRCTTEAGKKEVWENMETIVRQLEALPKQPAVIFVLTTQSNRANLQFSKAVHKEVAEYYGISCIDLDEYIWNERKTTTEEWTKTLSIDGTHPSDAGYQLYSDYIAKKLDENPDLYYKIPLENKKPKSDYVYGRPITVDATKNGTRSKGWTKETLYSYRFPSGTYLETFEGGQTITYTFKGRSFGLYLLGSAYSGNLTYSVDGGEEVNYNLHGKVANMNTMATCVVLTRDLKYGEHTITIKTVNNPASYDTNANAASYKKNIWRIGYFMIDEVLPEILPETEICPVYGNKDAIYSFTMDDSCLPSAQWFSNQFKEYDMKGTMALHQNGVQNWTDWESLFEKGRLDVISHSYKHKNLNTDASVNIREETAGATEELRKRFPKMNIVSYVWPYNASNQTGINELKKIGVLSGRTGGTGLASLSPSETEWYQLPSYVVESDTTAETLNGLIDQGINQKKWILETWHGILGEGSSYSPPPKEIALNHFAYINTKRDSLWIASLNEATQYLREKQSATLKVLSSKEGVVKLTLTDSLDNVLYDHPLTLKMEVEPHVKAGTVTYEGGSGNLTVKDGYAYFDVIPDRGTITVTLLDTIPESASSVLKVLNNVKKTTAGYSVPIKNNGTKAFEVCLVAAEYQNQYCLNKSIRKETILPGETKEIEVVWTGNDAKVFAFCTNNLEPVPITGIKTEEQQGVDSDTIPITNYEIYHLD